MSLTLGIRLLGGLTLTKSDRSVVEITGGRCRALLAYLLLYRQAPQSRQRLAFYLWPESTDAQGRANLRKELSRLRHCLPNAEQFLKVDGQTLQWLPSANFRLDVADLEAALKQAEQLSDRSSKQNQLKQALELYRGDLLPEFDDHWVLQERERLQQIYFQVLERLMELAEEQQDYLKALSYGQHLLSLDDLNEKTYAALMRLYGLNGDRAKGLQIYHQCLTRLREELGVDPSANTYQMYEQLLIGENTPQPASSRGSVCPQPFLALSPLVGRESEWTLIQQWASRIFEPEPASTQVLLLLGEPGIGKTRLLEELRAFSQANHAQILWGHSYAAEIMRPYGIWIDALRTSENISTTNLPPALGFLLPELGQPSQAPPDLSHLFDAVVQLLKEWANQSPLLVLLDDIQWLDEASSALLHYGIRLLHHLPVLFACTARSQELKENGAIAQVVQSLRREQRLQTLALSPLDREQTAALMRSTQDIEPSNISLALVNQVFIDSGGNPLFVLEIARSLGQKQLTHGHRVEVLIGDRLQQLDDATQEMLPWAAALGRSFKPSTLAQVADYPVTKLLGAITELEQRSIIRPASSLESEMGYDFAHDIVRQVVYQQISPPGRQLIHRQIAQKLAQNSTTDNCLASEIAYHASLGGDRLLAASASLTAAERCLKLFAYAEALELAQQGIEHCLHLEPSTRLPLQISLLRVCAIAGTTAESASELTSQSEQLLIEAKSLGLEEVEAIALETLMILQFERNNFTGVHQHSLQAAASQFASPATAARMLALSGSCLAEIGRDMNRAEALLLEAQSLAARVGLEIADIFSGLGCVRRHQGNYTEARLLLQQAWRLTQKQQDHWRECTHLSYLAMIELEDKQPRKALPYCQEILAVAVKIQGEGSEVALSNGLAALANYQLQQPNAAIALTEAIRNLKQVDAKRMLAYILIGAAEVDLNCDRLELAVNRAQEALQNAQIVNSPREIVLAWGLLIQGLSALGEHQQAKAELEVFQEAVHCHDLNLPAQIEQMQKTLKPF